MHISDFPGLIVDRRSVPHRFQLHHSVAEQNLLRPENLARHAQRRGQLRHDAPLHLPLKLFYALLSGQLNAFGTQMSKGVNIVKFLGRVLSLQREQQMRFGVSKQHADSVKAQKLRQSRSDFQQKICVAARRGYVSRQLQRLQLSLNRVGQLSLTEYFVEFGLDSRRQEFEKGPVH